MDLWKVLLLCFAGWLAYHAYGLWVRPVAQPRLPKPKPLLNLVSKKHWAPGEKVRLIDDGTFTSNIYRVAGNTFGEYVDRSCIAHLLPETKDEGKKVVSVFIDGLCVGCLSDRHAPSFYVVLQHAGLDSSVTSCNVHLGGGGVGIDGKKLPYSITLDINWMKISAL
ncbi:hypothetical protein DZC30_08295 [Comamonas testosteroni]|uniref:Uncharacterized protein n=1 Tax=Comamonas testosteroni TaxID=285 RepID=A0A373FN57_COMTE|nr:hypothetical protein DZC30_08295 [Comamonas testosteroni]